MAKVKLSLCVELRRLGLRPIRIRMRDLALNPRMSLLEDLAQTIAQNSGDDDFDALKKVPRPTAKDLDVSQLFDESIEFGTAQICPHILIFDGWDEISISASEGFRQRIEETLRAIRREISNGRRVRVVLTGRPSLDVEESRVLQSETRVLTVRPFTKSQLKGFLEALLDYRLKIDSGDKRALEKRVKDRNEGPPDCKPDDQLFLQCRFARTWLRIRTQVFSRISLCRMLGGDS